eukprot:Transcript_991.p3 GENE.Transcript_991~~Transcript_991.p3  ORF type:complete len:160 (-),score=59.97 Transcript_991:612-1091(-)
MSAPPPAEQAFGGDAQRSSKVQEFEGLINEQLKAELQRVLDERDRLYEQIAHLMQLRNNMSAMQEQNRGSLKTMVDLGRNFYVQARIPDTSWVYVDVGLGFHAQMTPAEAIAFSTRREAKLNEAAEARTERAAQLKAQIKLTIGAIDEIIAGRVAKPEG